MKQLIHKNFTVFTVGIIAIILCAVTILFIFYPTMNPDGAWSLSHTFSIIDGHYFRSTFAHDYMGFYNLPYMYGWYNAPLYFPFKHSPLIIYSLFFYNLIWVLLFLFFSKKILYKTPGGELKFFLLAVAFVLSTFTYYGRPETEILPLLLALFYFLRSHKNYKFSFLAIALLTAIIGMMHAVGGSTLFCLLLFI